ncbi:hypothetical protein M0R45_004158 [Rubus argutus]|uniref:Uncharacterized protein n=1 Tax=Rubus argutus TaxID=59490 RepID=A0AAW1YIY2_RUBAR
MGLGMDAYEPTRVPSLPSDITSVTDGHYHSLTVTSQGQLWAWGRDLEAQLGRGLPSPRFGESQSVASLVLESELGRLWCLPELKHCLERK